jgi:hypothetical protein
MTPSSFLDALKAAADQAAAAEDAFRREAAARAKALERERAFAFRRLNFMRAVAEAVAAAEDEAAAMAGAGAVLRAKLGWASDSGARTQVVERFVPVAQAMFAALAPPSEATDGENAPRPDAVAALAAFEGWYAETHPGPFWALFEHYMPETPVVDF